MRRSHRGSALHTLCHQSANTPNSTISTNTMTISISTNTISNNTSSRVSQATQPRNQYLTTFSSLPVSTDKRKQIQWKKRTFCKNYLSLYDRAAAGFLRGFWILTKYLRISGRYLLEDLLGKHSTSSQPVNTGKGTRGVFVDGMSMLLKYNFCPTTKSQNCWIRTLFILFFSGRTGLGSSAQVLLVNLSSSGC